MRNRIFEEFNRAESDELLTTGEAAAILNSSRQHVVDLCDRGDLPFVTVGKHRRVRRYDIEALQTRTLRMTRDQRKSLWQAYAIAGRIAENPEATLAVAKENLRRLKETQIGSPRRWLNEWERLLAGSVEKVLEALTSRSPRSRELRQNSPFAGVLHDDQRFQVLKSFGEHDSPAK